MNFQKNVESMQIGLKLLGYELPRYGVDGLFGPETASAVGKFINDNPTKVNEASAELRGTLDDLGYQEKSGQLTGGGEITDEISGVVSDILRDFFGYVILKECSLIVIINLLKIIKIY
jgi:hypothetical protein